MPAELIAADFVTSQCHFPDGRTFGTPIHMQKRTSPAHNRTEGYTRPVLQKTSNCRCASSEPVPAALALI